MKHLKKFCIYFIAVFTIAELCGFTGLVIKEVDKGTFYNLATKEALDFCVQLGLAAFTSLIPYSLSVATFLAFWYSGLWTEKSGRAFSVHWQSGWFLSCLCRQ